jgi:tetratricopeptide (TPR) repeat protein
MSKKGRKIRAEQTSLKTKHETGRARYVNQQVGSPGSDKRLVWIIAALIVLNVLVFWPVWSSEFVSLDDPVYVTQNPHVTGGLNWSDLGWAWKTGYTANWHPLTWMSHMIDVQLFGLNAGAHHLMSLVFHIANTLLLFLILRRMTGALWRSAFMAALFAVHPLHVESVAWIAERKDVLSTLFFLLTLNAYTTYVRLPGSASKRRHYFLVLFYFALGLLAKPMLVTLPFVLLLLDFWPLERVSARGRSFVPASEWRPLVLEKLPLFVLAAASSVVTYLVQQRGGAVTTLEVLPVGTRLVNAVLAYVAYIRQMLWPAHLAVFYPFPRDVRLSWVAVALLALVCISIFVSRYRRYPYLFVGWFWYLGTLVPVIGLIQVGMQSRADRYTYMPLIGLFIIVAWGVPDLLSHWRGWNWVMLPAALVATFACVVVARDQVRSWTDSMTLWTRALEADPDNYRAHAEVGAMLANRGESNEALAHFQECIRLEPSFPEARYNLGQALASGGRMDEAIAQYTEAVRLKPDFIEAQNGLGLALVAVHKFNDARLHFAKAVRLRPDDALSHMYLGGALASIGRLDEAAQQFQEVLRIDPKNERAQDALDRLARQIKEQNISAVP